MAEGGPINQIYDLLSTDHGMRLALRRQWYTRTSELRKNRFWKWLNQLDED